MEVTLSENPSQEGSGGKGVNFEKVLKALSKTSLFEVRALHGRPKSRNKNVLERSVGRIRDRRVILERKREPKGPQMGRFGHRICSKLVWKRAWNARRVDIRFWIEFRGLQVGISC